MTPCDTTVTPWNKLDADECQVPGCDRPRASHGSRGTRSSLCSAHHARKIKTGDVQAHVPVRPMHRGAHDVWCDYRTAHNRVKNARGPARAHGCADCGLTASEWSYTGGARFEFTGPHTRGTGRRVWSGDPADYEPRCIDCHRQYDASAA